MARLQDQIGRLIANRKTFSLWQSLGLHLVRARYDSPIPDTRDFSGARGGDFWSRRSGLVGVEMNEQGQLDLLTSFHNDFKQEYEELEKGEAGEGRFTFDNLYMGSVDAEILYCFVRRYKPRRVIEIGSGFSTLLSARALLKNHSEGHSLGELIAVEPYPKEFLRRGFPGLSRVITEKVQSLPLDFFMDLQEDDILFIDSSHIVKTGSDVCYEFLEILPRLPKGVLVHVHDIFLPSEYPRHQVLDLTIFYNEQYLLHAFLAFNSAFRVLWAGSFMHLQHPRELSRAIPSYDHEAHWPGSFWMQRIL